MIWGTKYNERAVEEHPTWFAWRPVHLVDGRWAWWQRVYYKTIPSYLPTLVADLTDYSLEPFAR